MSYGSRRQNNLNPMILIGAVLLVVVLIFLCVAGYLILRQRGGGAQAAAVPQPEMDVPTAREAYLPAVDVVRAEDAGAQLASAVGSWSPTINADNLITGRTGWTFYFYLPSSKRMVWVVVSRGGGARITQTQDWDTPPALQEDQGWQIDSGQAVATSMQTCQPTLDAHPDSVVEALLSLAADNRALVWRVSVTPGDPAAPTCVVSLDATTGQVR